MVILSWPQWVKQTKLERRREVSNPLVSIFMAGLSSHNHSTACQWRHNGRDGVSNHWRLECLFKRLFRRRSKKTSKLCIAGPCAGNSPVTGEFPAQRASNAENVFIWWCHHGMWISNTEISFTQPWRHWLIETIDPCSRSHVTNASQFPWHRLCDTYITYQIRKSKLIYLALEPMIQVLLNFSPNIYHDLFAWPTQTFWNNTYIINYPDNKVHGANMGPTWVLSAPDGPHVGPMNLAIRVGIV